METILSFWSHSGKTGATPKEAVLERCNEREDEWGREVSVRLHGAVSDLHAADARYHDDCRKRFMVGRLTPATCDEKFDEPAFLQLVSVLSMEKSKVWTASDIYDLYKEYGGTLKHRSLPSNLEEHYQGNLVIFWSHGLSSIVVFRTSASGVIELVDDGSSDSSDSVLNTASKQIM